MRDEELLIVILVIFAYLVQVGIHVIFLVNLKQLLEKIAPHNRKIEPGNVFLDLIPLFNLVYGFIMNNQVTDSVKAEMEERGMTEPGDYGKALGMIYPAASIGRIIPYLGILSAIGSLVVYIIYWVKMAGYKAKLSQYGAGNPYQQYAQPQPQPQPMQQPPQTPSNPQGGSYEDPFA